MFGSDLQFTLLRPTMIYGPGNDRNVAFIRGYIDSHRFLPVFGSGERLQQPVFVEMSRMPFPRLCSKNERSGRAISSQGLIPSHTLV